MKKRYLPILAAALTPCAYAQSNVTLYGVADLAIGRLNGETGVLSSSPMNPGASRVGFRGIENLGNGYQVAFQLEQGIRLNDGRTDAATFARQAWVSIASPLGTLRVGRQFSPTHSAISNWDIMEAQAFSGVGNVYGFGGPPRENALIRYISPTMSGLQLQAGYVFKDNYNSLGPFASPDSERTNGKYEVALIYKEDALAMSFSYNRSKLDTGWSHKSNVENMSLGGSYHFGLMTVAASYLHNDHIGQGYAERTNESPGIHGGSFGFSVPTSVLVLSADAVYAKERAGSKKSGTDWVVSAKHLLSKSTTLYGTYYHADKSGPAFDRTFKKQSNFALGIRHAF